MAGMAMVRVLPDRGFWVVSVEGRAEPEAIERTRRLADKTARPIARALGARLVIHRLDGGISFELQYPPSTKRAAKA